MHQMSFIVFDSSQIFRKFSLKSKLHSFNLLVGLPNRLLTPIKNNSWKRENKNKKQTNQNPFHAVLISESSLARQYLRGQLSRLSHTPRR